MELNEPAPLEENPDSERRQALETRVDLWDKKTDQRVTLLKIQGNSGTGGRFFGLRPARPGGSFGLARFRSRLPNVVYLVSPNKKTIALSVGDDFYLYNTENRDLINHITVAQLGFEQRNISGSLSRRLQLAFSSDSHRLMCKLDRGVAIVSCTSGERIHYLRLPDYREGADQTQMSPNGKHIAALNSVGNTQVWNVENGEAIIPPLLIDANVKNLKFSPDSKYLKIVSEYGSVQVWDILNGRSVTPLMNHTGIVTRSDFSRDASRVLVSSGNHVHVWPVGLPRHKVVSVSPEKSASDWRLFRGRVASPWNRSFAQISPNGKILATVWPNPDAIPPNRFGQPNQEGSTLNYDVTFWNADSGKQLHDPISVSISSRRGLGFNLVFGPDSRQILIAEHRLGGKSDRALRLLNIESGKVLQSPLNNESRTLICGFANEGSTFWTTESTLDAHVSRIWDSKTGNQMGPSIRHQYNPSRLLGRTSKLPQIVSRDGKRLVAISRENPSQFQIFDLVTGKPISQPVDNGPNELNYCWFSDSDRDVISASTDERGIQLCKWAVGETLRLKSRIEIPVGSLPQRCLFDCDPLGKRFALGPWPGITDAEKRRTGFVVDIEKGNLVTLHHNQVVTGIQLSPNGKLVLTDCEDRVTRLWDAKSGELVRVFENSGDPQNRSISEFSKNGKYVVVTRVDGALQVWDINSGQAITPVLQEKSQSVGVLARVGQINPSNVLTDDAVDRCVIKEGESFSVYDISADNRPVDELIKMTQVLSRRQINPSGNVQKLMSEQWQKKWIEVSESLDQGLLEPLSDEAWHEYHAGRNAEPQSWRNSAGFGSNAKSRMMKHSFTFVWHLDRLIKVYPDAIDLLKRRALLHSVMGNHELAIADYDSVEKLGENVNLSRGNSFAKLKKWKEAAAEYEKANKNLPSSSDPRLRIRGIDPSLGLAYFLSGQKQKYDQLCKKLIANETNNLWNLWLTLLTPRDSDEYESIQKALDSVSQRQRRLYMWDLVQALLHYRQGNYEQVLNQVDRVNTTIALTRSLSASALLLKAMAHKKLNDSANARSLYTKAKDTMNGRGFFQIDNERWELPQLAEILEDEADDVLFGKNSDTSK